MDELGYEFKEVIKKDFYAFMNSLDVTPNSERYVTLWETRNRHLVGKSFPGYLAEGPKRYFLKSKEN